MTEPQPTSAGVAADFVRTDIADARTVARFRAEFGHWLREHFVLDTVRLNDVLLAVNEALTNAAEFAYRARGPAGHRPGAPGPGEEGTVELRAHYSPAADGTLQVDVSDRGQWRHVDPAQQPNTRGRGIPLMRALADRITISSLPTGTRVRLDFLGCPPARRRCACPT